MSEPAFTFAADDDCRARCGASARRVNGKRANRSSSDGVPADERSGFAFAAPAATVTDFDVPFARLVGFFLKAAWPVFPRCLLLTSLLWL